MSIDWNILRLWGGNDDKKIRFRELESLRKSQKFDIKLAKLAKLSTRQFHRHLDHLIEIGQLDKQSDKNRDVWYFKTEKGKRKTLASFFVDWLEREEIGENRDKTGNSVIYSEPPISNIMDEERLEHLYDILMRANIEIVSEISDALISKRIGDLSEKERENVVFYRNNINVFIETKQRREKSGVVNTQKDEREVNSKLLRQAKLLGFCSIDEHKSTAGPRFHRIFSHLPLTFNEEKEYQDLKSKFNSVSIRLGEKFLSEIEDEMPRIFCCFYNFEAEELLLSENDLILTANDEIRPIQEVLGTLDRHQLLDYKEKLEKALRSRITHLPTWVGRDEKVQPKMRLSRENSTARKYLKWILSGVEKNLQDRPSV